MVNEKRVILSVKKFDKIKSKKYFKKIVWYFPNKKIVKINEKNFYEVNLTNYGKVKKYKTIIENPVEKDYDLKCQYKLEVFSKFPVVEGISLYLEKINVYPSIGRMFTFYSTEVENKEHLSNLELLSYIPGVKIVKEVDTNIYEIVNKRLFK